MTPEAMLTMLLDVNRAQCDPPLPDAEVQSISASVGRYTPEPDTQKASKPRPFNWHEHVIAHVDLLQKQLEPIVFLIKDMLIDVGTGVVASKKKLGKSLMALQFVPMIDTTTDCGINISDMCLTIFIFCCEFIGLKAK